MSLRETASLIKMNLETAAVEDHLNAAEDPIAARVMFELKRANEFLELNRERIFQRHLLITNRYEAERAAIAYNPAYFLQLPIPLEAVADLVAAIKKACKRYKVDVPRSWDDVINGLYVSQQAVYKDEDENEGRFKPEL